MSIKLGANNYGKSGIRLLRVVKQQGRHDIKELTIRVGFEGDFDAAHTKGDNQKILPTDTMKNTVYVLAKQYPVEAVEEFALHLIEHFLTYNPQVSRVRIEASENLWERLPVGGKPHASAFARSGDEKRTAVLIGTREGTTIRAGIDDLIVLKTTKSAFEGFLRDPYTTLKEDSDRILSTVIHAELALRSWRSGIQSCMARRASNNARNVCRTRQSLASTHALRDGRGSPQQLRSHRRNLSLASQQAFHSRESCSLWNGQSRRSFSAY